MRGRRRDDGSLELLLDTITNTFGGVLFLAILIALLIRGTSPRPAKPIADGDPLTQLELAALEVRIQELEAGIDALRRRAVRPDRLPATTDATTLASLDAATARLESALLERARSLQETARLQQVTESCRSRLAEISMQRDAAERELAEAVQRRDAARAQADELSRLALQLDRPPGEAVIEQTVGLPRIRPTDKDEVALYVRFGRVYMMHHWRGAERMGPNTAQFVVLPGVPQVARPKPDAGLVINPSSIDGQVDELLGRFSPQDFYVTCVVFEDSFDMFQVLKGALVKKGFEYRLIPRRPGESVVDRGGSGEAQ